MRGESKHHRPAQCLRTMTKSSGEVINVTNVTQRIHLQSGLIIGHTLSTGFPVLQHNEGGHITKKRGYLSRYEPVVMEWVMTTWRRHRPYKKILIAPRPPLSYTSKVVPDHHSTIHAKVLSTRFRLKFDRQHQRQVLEPDPENNNHSDQEMFSHNFLEQRSRFIPRSPLHHTSHPPSPDPSDLIGSGGQQNAATSHSCGCLGSHCFGLSISTLSFK
jgi:hypothetical protein